MIYLDYQATTPLAPEAREAMLPWLDGANGAGFANPASQHRAGRRASVAVEMARDSVAALLPAGGRVIFTSGATEALNWALQRGAAMVDNAVTGSAIEHAAVLENLEALGAGTIPVDAEGLVGNPEPALIPERGLVALMLVNNEVGTIQPVAQWAHAAHERGALLLCDAVQGYGRITIPDGPDMIAVSAHKIYGPKGIGALWIRDGIDLPPFIIGGGQELGLRSGTVSPALCVGFGAAAEVARARMADDALHVAHLWAFAMENLPGWQVNGSTHARWHGNLNIRLDGVNGARLLSDLRDIAFSLGSACASGSGKASHVLRAMGVDGAAARSSLRLGWGRYTTEVELRDAIVAIKDAAQAQREI